MITIKGYQIQEKIRHHHNIDTYHGMRLKDKCKVLLKIPSNDNTASDNLAILQNEFQLLNKIEVPAIIKAYDFLQNTTAPVLILEDVEGQLLSNYLIENQFEFNDFFDLSLQLVDILGELHQRNIIHKEIRPSNIIIDAKNLTLKLVDLSASSRLSEEAFDFLNLSQFSEDLAYISPEQTGRTNHPVDYRSDFYSLGITLYEMLTNQLPFQTTDTHELIQSHLSKKPLSVLSIRRNIPRMLAAIIDKLLEKRPEDRYSSYIGIKSDLQECFKQWLVKRNASEYSLGSKDVKDHLSISRKLYGREQQIHQLIEAFYRVSQATTEIVLIAGFSGIGKTSLVKEVHKPIIEHKGYFIQGKFDQLRRSIPYSAIVAAFQNLVKQVLSKNEETLGILRKQLMQSLGTIGQVVIDVIPEVELIIGKQPPVHPLNPTEAQTRFNLVFQNFVKVFAQPEHPLVLFLDDLQWADNSSLNFIENLLQDKDTKYLLIIGAYRDNEINDHHPLQLSLNNLSKNQVKYTTLTLFPLELGHVYQLLQDALSGSSDKIQSLVDCVFEKTQGNPFFINEFLKLIYQESLLNFSYEKNAWVWDLNEIQQKSNNGSIINLITAKIHLLTKSSEETLKLASCFGHEFDLKSLLIASGQPASYIAEQLWQAISANLIYPLEEAYKTLGLVGLNMTGMDFNISNLHYKFAHDRIQQATYELIDPEDRSKIHLKIGRLLLKEKSLDEHDERLFSVLKHFNQSIALIDDNEERHLLAKYNFWAGQKAKLETAYHAADEYLSAGVDFLAPDNWNNYSLTFQLLKECAVCKYLIGEFTIADLYFTDLLNNSRTELDKLEIYRLKIEMLSTLGKHTEALDIGLSALRNFKIKIPRNPNMLHILLAIYKVKFQLRNKKIEDIYLPPMEDLQQKAIVNLITQLFNSAFIINQKLFVLLTCKNISLSLKYGYTESTSMSIPVYAFVIMHSLNLYDEALSFVGLYNRLKREYGASNFEGKNQFVLGTFIEPYQSSLSECNQTVNNAFRLCCDVGDLVYGNYSRLLLVMHSMSAGKNLAEVKKNIDLSLSFMARVKISDFINVAKFWEFSVLCLERTETGSEEKILFFEEHILKAKNKTELSFFYSSLTRLQFLLGNFDEAIEAGEQHELYSDYDKGLISHLDGAFFFALSLFYQFPRFTGRKRKSCLKKLKHLSLFIEKYAAWCPVNYQVYSLLLTGEFARLNQQHESALEFYERVIKMALASDLVLIAAIANERAGVYCMEINLDRIAGIYLNNAYRYYKEWGLLTKVTVLEESFPSLILSDINSGKNIEAARSQQNLSNIKNLDMLAILKFTQIISGEIRLDKLLQKLVLVLLELAEAEQVIILNRVNDQWVIEAEGTLEHQEVYLNGLVPSVEKPKYPVDLLNYIERIQKPVILNDAINSELAFQDTYIQHEKPGSLLMMPLYHQSQLCRVIYVENNRNGFIFSPSHLNGLELFTTQAMTSLENAKHFYQVTHDLITGLANRNMLYELFLHTTKQLARSQGTVALIFLGLEPFKMINDSQGHDIEDTILIHIANTLTENLREGDTAARVGVHEFIIMLANTVSNEHLSSIIERLFNELSKPIQINDRIIQISASMGISIYPKDGSDIQTLLQLAEEAQCLAKEKGSNQFHFYSP